MAFSQLWTQYQAWAEKNLTFEEGIEQLRQEGTDMGGKDYEVTLEDLKEKEGFREDKKEEKK